MYIDFPISMLESHRDINKNVICCIKNDGTCHFPEAIDGLAITFQGKNNTVIIYQSQTDRLPIFQFCKLNLREGDFVSIKYSPYPIRKLIISSQRKNNCVFIEENFSCAAANFELKEEKTIRIGKDCMFSKGINLYTSDMHSILDSSSKVINKGSNIEIGDHVWVGLNAMILKGSAILHNSIIGAGSVVTKKFTESNVVIAGNPAQIVKRQINWDRLSPDMLNG